MGTTDTNSNGARFLGVCTIIGGVCTIIAAIITIVPALIAMFGETKHDAYEKAVSIERSPSSEVGQGVTKLLADARTSYDKYVGILDSAANKLSQVNLQIENARRLIEGYESRVVQFKGSSDLLRAEIAKLNVEVASVVRRGTPLKSEIADLTKRADVLKGEIEVVKQRNKVVKELQSDALKNRWEKIGRQQWRNRRTGKTLQTGGNPNLWEGETIEGLPTNDQSKMLQLPFHDSFESTDQLMEQLNDLRSKIETQRAEFNRLAGTYHTYQAKMHSAEDGLKQLSNEADSLTELHKNAVVQLPILNSRAAELTALVKSAEFDLAPVRVRYETLVREFAEFRFGNEQGRYVKFISGEQ